LRVSIFKRLDERMGTMKTDLVFSDLAGLDVELLAVVAGDAQTAKGAKPEPVLLTKRVGQGRCGRGAGFWGV
jgi:hypothetical protein